MAKVMALLAVPAAAALAACGGTGDSAANDAATQQEMVSANGDPGGAEPGANGAPGSNGNGGNAGGNGNGDGANDGGNGDDGSGNGGNGDRAGVQVTGVITGEGVECPALRGDNGQLYTLAGDTRGFGPGDRVRVRGTRPDMSICQQGTTITVQSIEKAN